MYHNGLMDGRGGGGKGAGAGGTPGKGGYPSQQGADVYEGTFVNLCGSIFPGVESNVFRDLYQASLHTPAFLPQASRQEGLPAASISASR